MPAPVCFAELLHSVSALVGTEDNGENLDFILRGGDSTAPSAALCRKTLFRRTRPKRRNKGGGKRIQLTDRQVAIWGPQTRPQTGGGWMKPTGPS